jgi:thiamine-phosphate pyrophosphorylase
VTGPRLDRRALAVYLVADPTATRGRALVDVVAAAARGGATLVQLRAKDAGGREMADAARALVALLRPFGVPLLVNDRVDVAVAAGADGAHVGRSDLDAADARLLLGPRAILGVSASTADEARRVDPRLADYVGAGPVYPTGSKSDADPPTTVAGLAAICAATPLPVVGIGGITAANAGDVVAAGAAGVSVISAVCAADDPEAAARALAAAVAARGAGGAGGAGGA